MGVRRALNLTLAEARKKHKLYTFGPLIHNTQVINLLEERSVRAISSLNNLDNKGTVVIRAHGVTPNKYEEIKNKNCRICDATCPHVIRVQKLIKKYTDKGYTTIIIGDKGHAEVVGLLGFSQGKGLVIENQEDLKNIEINFDKACIVAQTTQNEKFFQTAINSLKPRIKEAKAFNTICDATGKRQNEIKELAHKLDAVLIVGGKHSANTTRLFNIAKSINPDTFFIETEEELNLDHLKTFKTIGVTAGASTPNWLIRRVVNKINTLNTQKKSKTMFWLLRALNFFFKSDLSVAFGAAGLALASCLIQNISLKPIFILISFFYVLAMHIFNNLTAGTYEKIKDSPKPEFYKNNRHILLAISASAIISALILSLYIGKTSFLLILTFIMVGTVYNIEIIPAHLFKNMPYKKIKDIPGSRDIFTSLGWTTVIVIFPLISDITHNFSYVSIIMGIFVFLAVFLRTVLIDIKDVQNDMLIGKETLPVLLGEKKTRYIVYFLLIFITSLLIASKLPLFSLLLLILPVYFAAYLILYAKKSFINEFMYEIMIDLSFILVGTVFFIFWYFR